MQLRAGGRVLEVGCGAGRAVAAICESVPDVHVLALDRSASMIAKARANNREHVEAGRVRLLTTAFERANLEDQRFDVIFGFNVGLFWKGPAGELTRMQVHLKRGGRVYAFYESPAAARSTELARCVEAQLQAGGFARTQRITDRVHDLRAICVVAR